MPSPVLFVIEDNEGFRETLVQGFAERNYRVHAATDLAGLEVLLSEHSPDFALVDLKLEGGARGLTAIERILECEPAARIVVLTGYSSVATAVQAIKLGAVDYLSKPVSLARLEKALWTGDRDPEPETRRVTLARHEREYIEYVLEQTNGNITQAARWLGIHRQSLQRKLRKYTPR